MESETQLERARTPVVVETFEGTARSGKGTTVREVAAAFFKRGEKVRVIDQGQKFRSLAYLAVRHSIDFESPHLVDEFLQADTTPDEMLDMLGQIRDMTDKERDEMLYTDDMSKFAGKIGASDYSHHLATDLMHKEIEEAYYERVDVLLLDGRTLELHASRTSEHIGSVVFSAHFACDALIAARRVEKMFSPIEGMTVDEQIQLLKTADNIANRNASDMARSIDPLRRPSHALNFTYENYVAGDAKRVLAKCRQVDPKHLRLMVDTTRTESIDHMTAPLVEIAIAAADTWRNT